ncbi:hypothetical protein UFOVP1382_158 [uncultured Caudovirales phage]|uniref:Uncharacterized protein n=1 Tax=uncultured Caudovirales phage TaxID=2100421 RepID=A0A6J5S4L1_9CAUD|nr:hypothetical protein UFOVP1382_158 [uncultured Caudovirales phage]
MSAADPWAARRKAKAAEAAANAFIDAAARIPDSFSKTMETKDFKALLLTTDGWMMAAGYSYDIVGKSLGAGVYRVSLRRRGEGKGMK